MSLVDATELAIVNELFGGTAFAADATLYAALFTTVGADDGSGFTEATGGSYARVSVTNNTTNFPSANPKLNANAVTFPTATAGWGAIRGMGWYTASSAGTLRTYAYLMDQVVPMATALAATDIVTAPGHAFSNGTAVVVYAPAGVTLPTGLATNTTYYVIGASGNTFQLSATSGGSAVNITADGAMVIGRDRSTVVNLGDTPSFAASAFSLTVD